MIEDAAREVVRVLGERDALLGGSHARWLAERRLDKVLAALAEAIRTDRGHPMNTYTVSVDSEDDREGQWNDLLVVVAESEDEAKNLATGWTMDHHAVRHGTIGAVEAYRYAGSARVLGQLEVD